MAKLVFPDGVIEFMTREQVPAYNIGKHPSKQIKLPCTGKQWAVSKCLTELGYPILMKDTRVTASRFHQPYMIMFGELVALIIDAEVNDKPIDLKSLYWSNYCGKALMKDEKFCMSDTSRPASVELTDEVAHYLVNQEGGLEAFLVKHCGEEFQV